MTPATTTKTPSPERLRVRLDRDETLAELAARLYKDARVAPLLVDLNPAIGAGRATAGTVVVVPGKTEVQRFAARMGFTLGYDPAAGGSTAARRKWAALKNGGAAHASASAADLARVLGEQGLPASTAAARVLALVAVDDAAAFARDHQGDHALGAVAIAVQAALDRGVVRARLKRLSDLSLATSAPAGRRALVEGMARDVDTVTALLQACLVPDAESSALAAAAKGAVRLVRRAEEIADLDVHARDAMLGGAADRAALAPLVDAAVDRAPMYAGARLDVLGVARPLATIEAHLASLGQLVKKLVDALDDASPVLLDALMGRADPRALPRPWPVAAALLARLGAKLDDVHAGAADHGLAGVVVVERQRDAHLPREGSNPRLSVAELAARSAVNARVSDAHDGVPERLAPAVVALFDPLRPSAPDVGSEAVVRQRRQSRFEKAVLVSRGARSDGDVCASLVDELLALAAGQGDATLARRAQRLAPEARRGALRVARESRDPLTVLLRGASEVGRALVIAAIALDPELGPALARRSGQEAALDVVKQHGPRTLTLATQRYAKGSAA